MLGTDRHVDVMVGGALSDYVFQSSPPPTFVLSPVGQFNTIDILDTSAGVPIQVNTANQATVNIGNNGSVQEILAPVTLWGWASSNTISIDDSADIMPRTATIGTFSSGISWGYLSGLAPAVISYEIAGTNSVYISTGTGADAVDVEGTEVYTSITGHGSDTFNVGNAGYVQGIQGTLAITNPTGGNTININDAADPAAQTATLSALKYLPGWGEVTGLAPATILYNYANTTSLSLTTGTGGNVVDVWSTGVPTFIGDNSQSTVNLGYAGSVQGIQGTVYVIGSAGVNSITIDDSADNLARTSVQLHTFLPGWGYVAGLAPAKIAYSYASTSSLHLTTNVAGDTINVQETGVPTYISTIYHGTNFGFEFDTVTIGDPSTSSIQGIVGDLFISNPIGYTEVIIEDWYHPGADDANLSSFTGPDGRDWGSITGLSPGSINFAWNDMYRSEIDVVYTTLPAPSISWTVNFDASWSVVGVEVLDADGHSIN
jgi:hypothetical protein